MKRTPLPPRKNPLKRGKPPRRKKPLPKNRKRLRRSGLVRRVVQRIKNKGKPRFKRGRDPQYLEWIRGLPCLKSMARCSGEVQAAHVKSRGAGGADVGNTVPLCARHHEQQHRHGIKSWAEFYFLGGLAELRRIAAEVYPAQYEKAVELGWKPGGEFPE